MSTDQGQAPPEVDLERTDSLPIVDGTVFADDVADDAVKLDFVPVASSIKAGYAPRTPAASASATTRALEERLVRQRVEYEALKRAYDKARTGESAAVSQAQALTTELVKMRGLYKAEQSSARELGKTLLDSQSAIDSARTRLEQLHRDTEILHSEARALRDTVAARDAALAQVVHSLAERDAQLSALQREHARVVPALEERSSSTLQLEEELRATRARNEALAASLDSAQQTAAALNARLDAADRGAASGGVEALRKRVCDLEFQVSQRDDALARFKAASIDVSDRRTPKGAEGPPGESTPVGIVQQTMVLESERDRLRAALTERDAAARAVEEKLQREVRQARDALAQASQENATLAAQMSGWRVDAVARDNRFAALTAQLEDARSPALSLDAEVQRLNKELKARTATVEQANEENRALRAALERTRGALEEREVLIRRIQRSESINANVLGRIQSSIERLGAVTGQVLGVAPKADAPEADVGGMTDVGAGTDAFGSPGAGDRASAGGSWEREGVVDAAPAEVSAELVRIDGRNHATHRLGALTRIGRVAGSDLQIESSSVSRHHAVIGLAAKEIVIEDLKSTNGVLVNGRKVGRQQLYDGDTVTIGEATFRLHVRFLERGTTPPPPGAPE